MSLKIKLDRSNGGDGFYLRRGSDGKVRTMWRYHVIGEDDDIQDYLESKGEYARQVEEGPDKGTALFFSRSYVGETNTLIKTRNSGNYVAQTSAKTEKIKSTCDQLGDTPLGRAFASVAAQDLYATLGMGGSAQPVAVKETAKESIED